MFSSSIPGRVQPTGREPSLPGDKYNRLTLIHEISGQTIQASIRRWLCRCDCGKEKSIALSGVRGGHTRSCGCAIRESMSKNGMVQPGQVFGRLTVTTMAPTKNSKTHWNCICECGTEKVVYQNHLKSGATTSCGCRRAEVTTDRNSSHGMADTRTYHSWCHAKSRCTNPNDAAWDRYGGRGITFDPKWSDFEAFLSDMGECPEGLTLDRIDNDKGYGPGNCRWATYTEQARNKRNNVFVSYQGRNITLAEAAEISGTSYKLAQASLKVGASPASVFESPDFGPPI
jgi:hypothetical protein